MNDIQEIGLMLLPMLATGGLLVFGLWQLTSAKRVGKVAKARLRVD